MFKSNAKIVAIIFLTLLTLCTVACTHKAERNSDNDSLYNSARALLANTTEAEVSIYNSNIGKIADASTRIRESYQTFATHLLAKLDEGNLKKAEEEKLPQGAGYINILAAHNPDEISIRVYPFDGLCCFAGGGLESWYSVDAAEGTLIAELIADISHVQGMEDYVERYILEQTEELRQRIDDFE